MDRPERVIKNSAGMSLANASSEGILRGGLKVHRINPFIKLHRYLTKGSEWCPLTVPRPIGMDHPNREIKNFAVMSLAKVSTEGILRGPLKSIMLIPLLNYTVI